MADDPQTLPPRAREIYQEVFMAAKGRADSDKQADRAAWRVVKLTYKKRAGMWVLRKPAKVKYAARGRVIAVR